MEVSRNRLWLVVHMRFKGLLLISIVGTNFPGICYLQHWFQVNHGHCCDRKQTSLKHHLALDIQWIFTTSHTTLHNTHSPMQSLFISMQTRCWSQDLLPNWGFFHPKKTSQPETLFLPGKKTQRSPTGSNRFSVAKATLLGSQKICLAALALRHPDLNWWDHLGNRWNL